MESRRQCKIVLMNGRKFDITIQPKLLTQELLEISLSHLYVKEYWYFGLYVQDGSNTWWLRNHIFVLDHDFLKKEGVLTLYLGIRFFVRNVLSIKDVRAIELHYLQANKLFSLGQLAVTDKEAVRLAALIFQTEFGDFVNSKDYFDKCSKSKLLSHLECTTRPRIFWEEKIKSEYMRISGESRGKAAIEFLRIVCNNPMYGIQYFSLKDARGKPCWLGLSHRGVSMFEGNEKAKPTRIIDWEIMGNILYKGKRLSIEAPRPNNQTTPAAATTPNSAKESSNKVFSSDEMIIYLFQAASETTCEKIWHAFIDQHQFYLSFTQRAGSSKEIPQLAEQLNNVFTFAEGTRPNSFSSESSTHAKELVGHLKSKREQLNLLLQAKMKHMKDLDDDVKKVESPVELIEVRDRSDERSRQEDHATLCHLNELLLHNERVTMGYYKLVVLINKTISIAAKKMISVQALIDKPNVSASDVKSRWIEEYTKSLGKLKKVETKVNRYRKMFSLPVVNVASRCEDHKITKTPVSRTGMSNQCLCQNHSQELKTKQDGREEPDRTKIRHRSHVETSRTTSISSSSVRLRLESAGHSHPKEKPDSVDRNRKTETVGRDQPGETTSSDRPIRQLSHSKTNQSPSLLSTASSVSSSSSSFSHQFFPSGTDSASSSSSSSAFSQYLPLPAASGITQNVNQTPAASLGGTNSGKSRQSHISEEGVFKVPVGLPPRSAAMPSTEMNKNRSRPYDGFDSRGNRMLRWKTVDAGTAADQRQVEELAPSDDYHFRGTNNMYSVSTKKIIHYPFPHSSSNDEDTRMANVEIKYCPQCKKDHRQQQHRHRHQSLQTGVCPRPPADETAGSVIFHVPPTQQFAGIYANQAQLPLDSDDEEDFISQLDPNSPDTNVSAKNLENKPRKPSRKSDWLYGWACPFSGEVTRSNVTDKGSHPSSASKQEQISLLDHYYQSLSSVQTPSQPCSFSSIRQKSTKKLPSSTAANLASCFKTAVKDLNETTIESSEADRLQRVREEATPRSTWRDRDLRGGILTAYSSPPERVKTDLTALGMDLSMAQSGVGERGPQEMGRGRRNYGMPPISINAASELNPISGRRQEVLQPEIARGDDNLADLSNLHLDLSMRRNPYLEHQLKEKEFDACMEYFARMQLEHVGVFSGQSLSNRAAGLRRYIELERRSNHGRHDYARQQSQQTPQSHHRHARDSGAAGGRTPGSSSGHRSRSIQSRKSRAADTSPDKPRHPSSSPPA